MANLLIADNDRYDAPSQFEPCACDGWLVEVVIPRIAGCPAQMVFAAAVSDRVGAEQAVSQQLGGLHCAVHTKCVVSAKGLAQLGLVERGSVKLLERGLV